MSEFRATDLAFDADSHIYTLPTGRVVPSVTQILRETGMARDFEALGAISRRLEIKIAAARDRGTNVHLDTHAWDDRQLNLADVDPALLPYVAAWIECRRNLGLDPVTRERMVYHPDHDYCGTMDGVFRLPAGRFVLIDVKTGDATSAATHLQTAAYREALRQEQPDQLVHERWAVQLTPGRKIPYRVITYNDPWDFHTFAAHLVTFHRQRRLAETA